MLGFSANQIDSVRQNIFDDLKTFDDAFRRAGQIYN